jgi:hypothetical protein
MKSSGPIILLVTSTLLLSARASTCSGQSPGASDVPKSGRPPLEMSKAVVCKRVEGYEKFVPLPDSSLTSEDKLLVYYRPLEFKVEPVEKPKPGYRFRARFSQDGRIRRKGEKTVLMKKDRILEYDPTFETPSERIYLVNTVGLKGLPPGEYEYDIVLRDALDEGSTVTQSLPFTILPLPKIDPAPKTEGPDEPEGPPSPKTESKSPKKPARTH